MFVNLTIGPDRAARAAMCKRAHVQALGPIIGPTDPCRVYEDVTILCESLDAAELLLRALTARIQELEAAHEAPDPPDPPEENPRQIALKLCTSPGDASA